MTRELALLVVVAVTLVLLGLGVWAWRRRARRDSGIVPPHGDVPAGAEVISTARGFYVAATRHDQPLERLAIRGLAFRSRADVTVTDHGVAVDLPGSERLFLPAAQIAGADVATVAIDRVVERDGLARITWCPVGAGDTDALVDLYFRPQDSTARALADAIATLLPTPASTTPTGSDE